MAVLALWGGREAKSVLRRQVTEGALLGEGGHVVVFVDYDQPKTLSDRRVFLEHRHEREDAGDNNICVPLFAVCVDNSRLDTQVFSDCFHPLVQ